MRVRNGRFRGAASGEGGGTEPGGCAAGPHGGARRVAPRPRGGGRSHRPCRPRRAAPRGTRRDAARASARPRGRPLSRMGLPALRPRLAVAGHDGRPHRAAALADRRGGAARDHPHHRPRHGPAGPAAGHLGRRARHLRRGRHDRRRRRHRRVAAPRLRPRRAGGRAGRGRHARPDPRSLPRRRPAPLPGGARQGPRHRDPLLRSGLAALRGRDPRPPRGPRHRDPADGRRAGPAGALHGPGARPAAFLQVARDADRLPPRGPPRGGGGDGEPPRRLLRAGRGGAGGREPWRRSAKAVDGLYLTPKEWKALAKAMRWPARRRRPPRT